MHKRNTKIMEVGHKKLNNVHYSILFKNLRKMCRKKYFIRKNLKVFKIVNIFFKAFLSNFLFRSISKF